MNDPIDGAALRYLSDRARHALSIDAADAYRSLVVSTPGPVEASDVLESLKPADTVAGVVRDTNAAACVLSALWLWHDFLDASHTICQAIETPTGLLLHAIIHRREGDFSNAKYWYRRCVDHPVYPSLEARIEAIIREQPSDKSIFRLTASGWSPAGFVDLVESIEAMPDDPRRALAVTIQRIEWRTVFEFALREAARD